MEGPGFSWEKWDRFIAKRLDKVAGEQLSEVASEPEEPPKAEQTPTERASDFLGRLDSVLAENVELVHA